MHTRLCAQVLAPNARFEHRMDGDGVRPSTLLSDPEAAAAATRAAAAEKSRGSPRPSARLPGAELGPVAGPEAPSSTLDAAPKQEAGPGQPPFLPRPPPT
jgi:hypothetical protein